MMRRPRTLLAFLVMAVLVAGCAGQEPSAKGTNDRPPPALPAHYLLDELPADIDHDHADPLLHEAAFNFALHGFASCSREGTVASAPGGFTDMAFHGRFAYVGHSRGFCVLDVTDPSGPRFVGEFRGEDSSDLEISHDGRFVFFTTQRNDDQGPHSRGDTEPSSNLPRGVVVVNVETPSAPAFESYYPVPTNGVHTATAYEMDGRQLLFIQSYDWSNTWPVDKAPEENPPVTQRLEVTELQEADGQAVLVRLATWSLDRPATSPLVHWFPHDSAAQFHPMTKRHLLYLAYWDAGLVILDVTEPTRPTIVSQYSDRAPSPFNQYHDVRPFGELIDGRHITVAGPETVTAPVAGHVRVFDTTDPAEPVQLGTWRLPGDPGSPTPFLFSPHVFTLSNGTIWIGHQHGGVWAIDVHNESLLRSPMSSGYYSPRGNEATAEWSSSSSVWGAYHRDGFVYATEATSGVHVLRPLMGPSHV